MKQLFNILLLSVLLTSCRSGKKEEPTQAAPADENAVVLTDAQLKNAGIVTGTLKQQTISSVLKVSGRIDVPPQNMVSISVPLGGYLKSTGLLPGTHVRKGEILGVMEDQQYIQLQQDYLTTKAQFSYTESEYNRQRELNQSKATSDKVFEQAKAAYQTQNVLLKSLGEKLRLIGVNPDKINVGSISRSINIYSPIDGYVSAVKVNIGKYVNPSDVLFELINPTDIHLGISVFEKDVDKLFIGQRVVAYTNSKPEKKHDCEIILISKNLSSDRSTEVHCHFEKYDKTLLPGMYMNAEIDVTTQEAQTLPDEAFVRFNNKTYVFVSKAGNHFEMTEVKTGSTQSGYTEIILTPDLAREVFVTKGAYNLLMKLKNTSDE